MKKLHIGVFSNNYQSAGALYRTTGPFKHLQRTDDRFEIKFLRQDELNFLEYIDLDAIVLKNFTNTKVVLAQEAGLKVIIDIDDDNFNIQPDNPMYDYYSSTVVKEDTREAYHHADMIMVTTWDLAKAVQEQMHITDHHKVKVVPNAIDARWFHSTERGKTKAITWRGGNSHFKDTFKVTKDLHMFLEENPYIVVSYGFKPFYWQEMFQKFYKHYDYKPFDEYIRKLQLNGAEIGIVPLEDNLFNRSKSNIAWLELAMTGHIVIAKDLPEFQKPGVITYTDSMYEALIGVTKMYDDHKRSIVRESRDYILENYTLDRVNEVRGDLLSALLS